MLIVSDQHDYLARCRDIEAAALRAWPALEEQREQGWLLRFAGGYTKRANAATLLEVTADEGADGIARCEQEYQRRGLVPIFRLPSFVAPSALDALLAERGYRRADETLVLLRVLPFATPTPDLGKLRAVALEPWLDVYQRLQEQPQVQREAHGLLLAAICEQRVLALWEADGQNVACGLGVRDGALCGLFDLVVAPALRGQGHGSQLITAMLGWAAAQGATHSYLQVVASNAGARRLYARLGFQELYRYWYRIHESS